MRQNKLKNTFEIFKYEVYEALTRMRTFIAMIKNVVQVRNLRVRLNQTPS